MKSILAILTDEEQSFVRTISRAGMPTLGTCLATVVGIDLDSHTLMQQGFIGNHAMQLSKAPLRISGMGFPLLPRRLFSLLAFGSFPNMRQLFQTDQALWVLHDDAFRDDMIGVLRSPVSPVH
jgi:hypothetical protein